jgi:hypothetical protein
MADLRPCAREVNAPSRIFAAPGGAAPDIERRHCRKSLRRLIMSAGFCSIVQCTACGTQLPNIRRRESHDHRHHRTERFPATDNLTIVGRAADKADALS